ncbi:hypothetical protein LCGC14_2558690, partial [marine sediment metagenome]
SRGKTVADAEDALYEVGFYEGKHYETISVRVGHLRMTAIRSTDDDRETLGEIAKQLVIAGIPFRLVTVK